MEIKHADDFHIDNKDIVKCTVMGNIVEVMYMDRVNKKQTIQMLQGGEEYMTLSDGVIHDVQHHDTRQDNKKGLYKTFAHIRALINSNVVDVSCVRWCTLTYAENMTDTVRLHNDFRKFNMRFQAYCKKHYLGKYEYIAVMEPQARGAWHVHLLLIWEFAAPFIPNADLARIWGFGFVSIKSLQNVDNVGAYLTAYLGDVELENLSDVSTDAVIKEIEVLTDDGKKIKKKFIKGGRLNMYPANFNMVRHSRGIKKPLVYDMLYAEAKEKVSVGALTYSQTFLLSDTDTGYNNTICKEYYNLVRRK